MRPAVPAAATFLACHQLWSSLLIICRMSPVLKGMPAWAQGIRSSSIGSYSNWARTKMSQGGGADRYEGTIWNEELLLPSSVWYYCAHLEGDASSGLPQQLLQALNGLVGHTYPINFPYFIPNMKSGLKVLVSILCSYTKGQLVSIAEQKA